MQYLMKEGSAGKAHLCSAVEKSPYTIDRWIKQGVPSGHDAYKLALACGLKEEDALKIGEECASERPKRSA